MATFTVSANLSFEAAISAANARDGADTIRFARGIDAIELSETITIEGGGLIIDGDRDGDGVSDLVLSGDEGPFLTVSDGAVLTIRNVDFVGAETRFDTRADSGADGENGRDATPLEGVGLDGGFGGSDAASGTSGLRGQDGEDAVGAILNRGTLTLERVGFGDNTAIGQSGGDGGDGGVGGGSRGGAGSSDDNPYDTPRPVPEFSYVQVGRQQEILFVFEPTFNNGELAAPGGTGGAAGPGADGEGAGRGGDGGAAAGAILNEGTLTLTDVVFGGRLTSGMFAAGNTATGGAGGLGGAGGDGGVSVGGTGGSSGKEWTVLEPYTMPSPDEFPNGTFYLSFDASSPGAGGAAGVGGDGGGGGNAGDGGVAATIVNRGALSGLAAGTGEATGGFAAAGSIGGAGGASTPGEGGVELRDWYQGGFGGRLGGFRYDDFPAEFDAYFAKEEGADYPDTRPYTIETGERGPSGGFAGPGRDGAIGGEGDEGDSAEGILHTESGSSVTLAASLVYIHALGQDEDGMLGFNVIRIGATDGVATVSWRLLGDGAAPVSAADFVGGVLPTGSVTLAAADAKASGQDPNVRAIKIAVATDTLVEPLEGYRIELTDAVGATLGTSSVSGTIDDGGALFLEGTENPDSLTGGDADDGIAGFAGADTLNGGAGDDTIDGGSGPDLMIGGPGGDRIVVDDAADRVGESRSWAGTDTVVSSVDFRTGNRHIENVELTGDARIGAGNGLRNIITGNDQDNILDGGKNVDTLIGGAGDDIYLLRAPGDNAVETADGGIDTVRSFGSFKLDAHVEKLFMQTVRGKDGSEVQFNGIGNDLDNTIIGTPFDNTLVGREGRDTLKGQAGADTFVFDRAIGADNVDRIVDFNANTADEGDILKMKATEFGGIAAGVLSADLFVAGVAAVDADDRFIFDQASGSLWFDTDGSGAGAKQLIATFDQDATVGAEDILVF